MPEEVEVTACAPAYSDWSSTGTNSSSMVILTKRSEEQRRGGAWQGGKTFQFSLPLCCLSSVTPYITVLCWGFSGLILCNWETENVALLYSCKTEKAVVIFFEVLLFLAGKKKGYVEKPLGLQAKAFPIQS